LTGSSSMASYTCLATSMRDRDKKPDVWKRKPNGSWL